MTSRSCNKFSKRWNTVKRQVERAIVGVLVQDKYSHAMVEPHNVHYKNLQKCYLLAFYLATFADWLQGPYIYKLYSDYGFTDDKIALLYVTGFASSCLFGTFVGQLADRYGRKMLCSCYGVLYSLCCLSKTSSQFWVLFIGRVLGGIATSILFTAFDAWYLNEHLNFYKLPPEWLNSTFTKVTFYNGLSAIVAGLISHVFAEYLEMGPVAPFIIAIPFLLFSVLVIQSTWKEHSPLQVNLKQAPIDCSLGFKDYIKLYFAPLHLLFKEERILLYFGSIQAIFEAVMYTFIFSWTPILEHLNPPLGLVFSLFMIASMLGSKIYSFLISRRYQPHNLLIASTFIALISFCIVTLSLTNLVIHVLEHEMEPTTIKSISLLCLTAFLVYECSVGMYYPAMGYLRGRVVPEECRTTLGNWFRVPMNIITCVSLLMTGGTRSGELAALKRFQFLFITCTVLLLLTVAMTWKFSNKYIRKVVHDELAEVRTARLTTADPGETV